MLDFSRVYVLFVQLSVLFSVNGFTLEVKK